MVTKRIEWIDICKGLGIFLVVIGHTSIARISQTLYDWIYSFHMPMFYMLSGMVFNPTKYSSFGIYLKRRIKTLVIPFFILNTTLFFCAKWVNLPNIQPPRSELLTGVLAMYFLRVLFISELWYYGCYQWLNNKWLRLTAVIAIIIGCHLIETELNYTIILFPSMPMFYFALGHILKEQLNSGKEMITNKYLIVISLATLCISLLVIPYSHSYYACVLPALVGIVTLMSLSMWISNFCLSSVKNKITYIGINTLVIVASHQIIYNSLKLITTYFIKNQMVEGCVRICLLWILLIIMVYLFNHYLYWILGKSKR